MKRYRVMQRVIAMQPDGSWKVRDTAPFSIFDELWGDFCALPMSQGKGKPKKLQTLEWDSETEALDWLEKCAVKWRQWQAQGSDRVPQHWAGFPVPTRSPWEGYTTPITPYN